VLWGVLLVALVISENPIGHYFNDWLLAGIILRPLELAIAATFTGAYFGDARRGAIIGLGCILGPVLLCAAAVALAYLLAK
jgi:hypothetical protein